jgi:hypothetical protein
MVDDSWRLDNEAIKLFIYIIYEGFRNLYYINMGLATWRNVFEVALFCVINEVITKRCWEIWIGLSVKKCPQAFTSDCKPLIKVTN